MRRLRDKKILILVVCGIIFMALNSSVNRISLNNRGVILGLAIDCDQDGNYVMTVQEVISSSGGSKEANSYYTVTGKGKTMNQAIKEVNDLSGVESGFRHAIIVMVSNELSKQQIDYVMSFFFVNNTMPDSALFTLVEGNAKEALSAKAPSTLISTFQLRRIFASANPRLGVNVMSLRQYNIIMNQYKGTTYLPISKLIKEDNKLSEGESGEGSEDSYLFNANSVGLITDNGIIELDQRISSILSAIKGNVKNGALCIEEENRTVCYAISSLEIKEKYSADKMQITYQVKSRLRLSEIKENDISVCNVAMITPEDYLKYESEITKMLIELVDMSVESGYDFLGICEGFYSSGGRDWLDNSEADYLKNVSIKVKHSTIIK